MTIPLEAVVGELHLIGGVRQDATRPTAAIVAPRHAARGRTGDTLFILVELRGPEPLPYEAVIDRIEAAYWRTPGSITSALRAALTVTNDWLMDRNVQAEVADRIRAGITCAVLRAREAEVFIAQAGPAAAYVAHHGQVERFPVREVTPQALGASRALDVRFSHAALNPGDVVLLCDSATAERVTDEDVTRVIVYTGVEAALQKLEKLVGSGDLIALVIEGAAEAKTQAAIRAAVERAAPQTPVQAGPPSSPAPADATPSPLVVRPVKRPSAEELVEADKARWVQRMAERAASLSWLRRGARGSQAEAPSEAPDQASLVEQPEAVAQARPVDRPEVGATEPGQETIPWTQRIRELGDRLHLRERGRAIARSLAAGFVVALRGLAMVLRRTLPEDVAVGQRSRGVNTLLVTVAALIPVAVAMLVMASYTEQKTTQEYEARLSSARNEANQAITFGDIVERRKRWVSALEQAGKALELFPDSADAKKIREDALRALDQLDNVVRVTPTLLWDFRSTVTHRLAGDKMNVFVLDRLTQQVFELALNEAGDGFTNKTDKGEPPARASKGTNVNDRMVGDLIDLVWMPQEGTRARSSLAILDTGGLLEYEPAWERGGLRSVLLGQGIAPGNVNAIAGFGGNLYLLDYKAGQIWRCKPQGDGYGGAPEPYFDRPMDLSGMTDLSIDGNVYLLQSNGRVHKFFGGIEKPFIVSGLAEPLKSPVALTVEAGARQGAVYVADKGMARVVQLTPEGAFVRQIRATNDAFNGLEDLMIVHDRDGQLFVVSGGKLYTARVPAAP